MKRIIISKKSNSLTPSEKRKAFFIGVLSAFDISGSTIPSSAIGNKIKITTVDTMWASVRDEILAARTICSHQYSKK